MICLHTRQKPNIYYTVLKYRYGGHHTYPIGSYSDIRDAMQAITVAYRRNGGEYGIESSTKKPIHWVHKTRYKDRS
jgi:hypothetical protein